MPNEFLARNGLIAQNNSIISGSLTTTGIIQTGTYIFGGDSGSRLSNNGTLNLQFSTNDNNSHGLSIGRATDNGTAIILRRGAFYATAIGVEGSAGANNNSGVTTFSYYYQANPASAINDGAFIELMRLNPPGVGNATLDVSGSARFEGNTTITGSLNVTAGITGSLFGTAATASYVISASYASTASYVANASSFPFTGSAIITGSLVITGSTISTGGFTGSLFGTAATASYIQALSGYTTASRTLTINGQSYDLTADRSWTVPLSGSVRTIQKFIATAGQTSFTINGGYVTGLVDVYINGVKLDNNGDFTATNGTTVVLTVGAMLNDIVEVYNYVSAFTANNTLRVVTPFTATAAQTTFTVDYTPGFVDVFYNGSKLAASEYTSSNGTTIVLGTAAQLNDIIEVIAYSYTVGAFTGIGGSGTANYVAKFISGSTIATSSIYDSGSNVGINTTNPIYTLDVSGSARFTNTATITGSLNVSGSNTLIGTKTITGSVFISGSKTIIGTNTITGSLNVSGSSTIIGATVLSGSLTVSGSIISNGTLTAQTLVVQTITSSVLYSSGSNVFGNSLSNTQVMTGSVGITGSLAVAGTGTFSGQINSTVGNNGALLSATTATTGYQYIDIITTSGRTQLIQESSVAGTTVTNSTAYASMFGSAVAKDLILFTNGAARITISGSNGNVGIGTTAPAGKLDVYVGSYQNLIFKAESTNQSSLRFNESTNGPRLYSDAGTEEFRMQQSYTGTGFLTFYTGPTERMRITPSGSVGIGTASPVANDGTSKTLQLGSRLIIQDVIGTQAMFSNNAYYDGTWKYAATATARAMRMGHVDGFSFHTTGSGTAGATLTNWDTTDVKMVILNSGNVGIGTTSPTYKLTLQGASQNYSTSPSVAFYDSVVTTNARNWMIGNIATDYGSFNIASSTSQGGAPETPRLTITKDGNVGIGTTSPSSYGNLTVVMPGSSNGTGIVIKAINDGGTASQPALTYLNGSGNYIAQIVADNGTGYLAFNTGTSNVERMRITSTGTISATSNASSAYSFTLGTQNATQYIQRLYSNTDSNTSTAEFLMCDAGASVQRMSVRGNGGIYNYTANNSPLSDQRLKKDITPLESVWDKVKGIEIVKYKFKDQDHDDFNMGVIAQQVETIAPELINPDGWGTLAEDNTPYKGIWENDMHYYSIKALQEAMAKIEEQQTLIQTLQDTLQRNNII